MFLWHFRTLSSPSLRVTGYKVVRLYVYTGVRILRHTLDSQINFLDSVNLGYVAHLQLLVISGPLAPLQYVLFTYFIYFISSWYNYNLIYFYIYSHGQK